MEEDILTEEIDNNAETENSTADYSHGQARGVLATKFSL